MHAPMPRPLLGRLSRYLVASLCATAIASSAASAAVAEPIPTAKVDYEADVSLHTADLQLHGHVHSSGGNERRVHDVEGTSQVIIMRRDKGVVWVLMDEQKMYMEIPLPDAADMGGVFSPKAQLNRKKQSTETVNGEPATKYTADLKEPNGSRYRGHMWVTKDDIIVKVACDQTHSAGGKPSKRKKPFNMELKNLRRQKQAAKLFALPKDYESLPTAPQ